MASFRLYVEKVLLSTLHPGEILIMDNLGSHRSNRASAYRPLQFHRSAAIVNPEPILGHRATVFAPSPCWRLRRYGVLDLGPQDTQVFRKPCEQLFQASRQIADQSSFGCISAELFQVLLQVFHRYAVEPPIQTN